MDMNKNIPMGEQWTSLVATTAGMWTWGYVYVSIIFVMLLLPDTDDITQGMIASASLLGAGLGQIIIGILSDSVDARTASIITAVISMLGCLLAASAGLVVLERNTALIIGRFLSGLGAGSEVVVAAKLAKTADHGVEQLLKYSEQANQLGNLSAPLVFLLAVMTLPSGSVWRVVLAFGALPSIALVPLRLSLQPKEATQTGPCWEKVIRALGSETVLPLGFQVSAWSLYVAVNACVCAYGYTVFEDVFPAAGLETDLKFGIYYAAGNALALLSGLSTNMMRASVSLTTVQAASALLATLCLLASAFLSSYSQTWLLLGTLGTQMFFGSFAVSAYTTAATIVPVGTAGFLLSLATSSVLIISFFAVQWYPVLEDGVGLRSCYCLGAVLLMASAFVTKALVEPNLDEGKEKLPLLNFDHRQHDRLAN